MILFFLRLPIFDATQFLIIQPNWWLRIHISLDSVVDFSGNFFMACLVYLVCPLSTPACSCPSRRSLVPETAIGIVSLKVSRSQGQTTPRWIGFQSDCLVPRRSELCHFAAVLTCDRPWLTTENAVMANSPVEGSYISASAMNRSWCLSPPVTSPRPSFISVAVCPNRNWAISPVSVKSPVAGS